MFKLKKKESIWDKLGNIARVGVSLLPGGETPSQAMRAIDTERTLGPRTQQALDRGQVRIRQPNTRQGMGAVYTPAPQPRIGVTDSILRGVNPVTVGGGILQGIKSGYYSEFGKGTRRAIGSFAPGGTRPSETALPRGRDLLVEAARDVPRNVLVRGPRSITGRRESPDVLYTPRGRAEELLYGKEPITPVGKYGEESTGLKGTPAVVAGSLFTGMEFLPGGKAASRATKGLIKETTEQGAKNIARQVGKELSDDAAKTVTKSTDRKEISNILKQAPAAPRPPKVRVRSQDEGQEVFNKAIARVKEEQGRYKENPIVRVKNAALRTAYDPLSDAQRYDNLLARATGTKLGELDPAQTFTGTLGRARNTQNEVIDILKQPQPSGQSVDDIFRKYGVNADSEQGFMKYAQMKFDQEFRGRHGRPIDKSIDDDGLNAAIRSYESRNTDAIRDARVLKEFGDTILDYGVEKGVIPRETAEFVKRTYQNYVPLERMFADDVPRINVSGGIRSSVGKQRFIQALEGSNVPLVTDFSTLGNRAQMAIKQGRTNLFDQEVLRRAQGENTLPGSRVIVDPDQAAMKKQLQETHRNLVAELKSGSKQLSRARTGARIQAMKLSQRQRNLVEVARNDLYRVVDDPDAAPAIKAMSPREILDTYDSLLAGSPQIERLRPAYLKNKASLNKFRQTIADTRTKLDELDTQRQQAFEAKNNIQFDSARGLAVIRGFKEGNPFTVEIPIDLAKGLAALAPGKTKDFVTSIAQAPTNLFKMVFTGVLNPVFTAVNVGVKNPALMFVNAKGVSPFGPRAIRDAFYSLNRNSKMQTALRANGYTRANATMSVADQRVLTQVMASRGGIKNYANFLVSHPAMAAKDLFNNLNRFGAILDNMQRSQVGAGLYYHLVRRNVPEDVAMRRAAEAANEVLGNFQRVTTAARQAEPLLLYAGATQAGARAVGRAAKTRPVETTLKLGALVGGAGIATMAALSSDEGKAYYDDMREQGKEYVLDGNIHFFTPGAHKDPETGEWKGVFKFPIAPDFRPLLRAVWQNSYESVANNQFGVDPVLAAKGVFDYFTGDIRNSAVDPETGPLGNSPMVQQGKILAGVDPRTNEPLVNEFMAGKPKSEQVFDSTTGAAKGFARVTGNRISPVQADKILGSLGLAGQAVQNREDKGTVDRETKVGDLTITTRESDDFPWPDFNTSAPGQTLRGDLNISGAGRAGITMHLKSPSGKTFDVPQTTETYSGGINHYGTEVRIPKNAEIGGWEVWASVNGQELKGTRVKHNVVDAEPVNRYPSYSSTGAIATKATREGPTTTQDPIRKQGTGGPLVFAKEAFARQFKGGFGSKESTQHFQAVEEIGKTLPSEDDFRFYQSLNSKNSTKSVEDSAARAQGLLSRPSVLGAMARLDQDARQRGEGGDPFFELDPDQQQRVLRYRASKDLNSAKQAYDKDGNPLFLALGLDESWYDQYREKEDAHFASIMEGQPDSPLLTYSGAKKPEASPELEKKMDYYYTLPKGTGARSDFLSANPDVLEFWAKGNQFTNAERIAMGMSPLGEFEDSFGGSSGFARGGRGGGRGRTAYVRQPGEVVRGRGLPSPRVKTTTKKVTVRPKSQKGKKAKVTSMKLKV